MFNLCQKHIEGRQFTFEDTIDEHRLIYCDIVDKANKTILEVDGAHHFLFNDYKLRTGQDRFHDKLYQINGYTVKRVTLEEFEKLDRPAKVEMINALFN